jgi:hypothetical protein
MWRRDAGNYVGYHNRPPHLTKMEAQITVKLGFDL